MSHPAREIRWFLVEVFLHHMVRGAPLPRALKRKSGRLSYLLTKYLRSL